MTQRRHGTAVHDCATDSWLFLPSRGTTPDLCQTPCHPSNQCVSYSLQVVLCSQKHTQTHKSYSLPRRFTYVNWNNGVKGRRCPVERERSNIRAVYRSVTMHYRYIDMSVLFVAVKAWNRYMDVFLYTLWPLSTEYIHNPTTEQYVIFPETKKTKRFFVLLPAFCFLFTAILFFFHGKPLACFCFALGWHFARSDTWTMYR